MARIEPFCVANNISLGYFDGIRVFPRIITERNKALYLYNNHVYLIWRSEVVSFNKTFEELERSFKIVVNFITEENVNSHFKHEFIPKKTA